MDKDSGLETRQNRPTSLLTEDIRRASEDLGIREQTQVQKSAIPEILSGEDALIIAPTGSGKTEAALIPILQKIASNKRTGGIRALYITPLRALNRDMLRRLTRWGEKLGISVEVRHGDTPQKDRRRQALSPPEILITTPETLQVLLVGSRLREGLANVEWVVIDEIHQLASDRRGAQLTLGLARLERLTKSRPQRIGLSATVANPDEVAQFLSGSGRAKIVDESSIAKVAEYRVEMPEPSEEDRALAMDLFSSPHMVSRLQRIADLVDGHESTLVFVNSRTLAEYISSKLVSMNRKVGVHHGSLPREERERVESEFKAGRIKALVCTSTMELGIDIGSVDLVVQYMSPRQVNSLVQRVGRSGHSLERTSEGIILTVTPEDATESIVTIGEASARHLELVEIHECPLDVLCHQIAGVLLESGECTARELLDIFTRAYPYRSLTESTLLSVVKYMEVLGYLRLEGERLTRRGRCREYYLSNLSMIPDERRYSVIDVTNQQKVGILGEEFMILHAKVGIHFVIKGLVWQIESIQDDLVHVTPVKDPTAAIPGWDGELIPIPEHIAKGVARLRGDLEKRIACEKQSLLADTKIWNTDRNAREAVVSEIEGQMQASSVPTDRRIVVEKFGRYLIIHTSAGDRINLTLGELFEEILLRKTLIRHWWNDSYRLLIELATDEFDLRDVTSSLFAFDHGKAGFLNAVIRKHFPFGYYLKFIAERFGALKRGMMLSDGALKELVLKFRFTPVYEETLREALMQKVDVNGTLNLLERCSRREVEVETVESSERPSPLAMYILSRYAEEEDYGAAERDSVQSMRGALSKEIVSLLCFGCGNLENYVQVGSLQEKPACGACGSFLLAPMFYGASFAKESLEKKKRGVKLSEQESDILMRARRSADLVLSYGRLGVIAQCVYGVGPQTASKVLSKMHEREEDLYEDLVAAKLNFIRTRQYWD